MIGVDYHLDCAALRYGFVRCHRGCGGKFRSENSEPQRTQAEKMKNDKARANIIKPSYISYNWDI